MTEEEIIDLVKLASGEEYSIIQQQRKKLESLSETIDELRWRENIYLSMISWLGYRSKISDEERHTLLLHMRQKQQEFMPTFMLEELLASRKKNAT